MRWDTCRSDWPFKGSLRPHPLHAPSLQQVKGLPALPSAVSTSFLSSIAVQGVGAAGMASIYTWAGVAMSGRQDLGVLGFRPELGEEGRDDLTFIRPSHILSRPTYPNAAVTWLLTS